MKSITSRCRSCLVLILNPSKSAVILPAINDDCTNPTISPTDQWGFVTRLLVHFLPLFFPRHKHLPRSQFVVCGTWRGATEAGEAAGRRGGWMKGGQEDPWDQHSSLITAPSSRCSLAWTGWRSMGRRKSQQNQFLSQKYSELSSRKCHKHPGCGVSGTPCFVLRGPGTSRTAA